MQCFRFCNASAIIALSSLLAHQAGAQPATGNNYAPLGCFTDTKEDRVLGDKLTNDQEMTTEFCYTYCVGLGALWMATQYGIECWCTTEAELDYARHGEGAQCDYDCAGDETESCGGYNAFNLFRIDSDSTPSDGGTAPTPVDGETDNDEGDGTEGDGDTSPTPVDGETDNDEGDGTEDGNEYTYVGCFTDTKADRVLGDQLTNGQEMTTEFCFNYCVGLDALWMATQYGIECWCTTEVELDYARHGGGAQCNYDCAGDETESCGGYNAFDLYRIDAAFSTSDGDTSPTPVDGGTDNDEGDDTEGDGDTTPTPVDGEADNDEGDDTEGDGDTSPTPVDGEADNDEGDGTEGDGDTTPTPVDGGTDNDEGGGTEGDGDTTPTPVDGETDNDEGDGTEGDGDTTPTPVDGETDNDEGDGTEGDGDTTPTPVDGGTDNDEGDGTEGGNDYTYLGCFKDTKLDRILGDQLTNGQDMTTEFCYGYCNSKGATLMATQYAIECWCTSEPEDQVDYARHGDGAQCNYDCVGDEDESCGGFNAFSLYRINSASTTSDGDTSPTPVDGENDKDEGDGTEGDGNTAPTPVYGETDSDEGNGTEGETDTLEGAFSEDIVRIIDVEGTVPGGASWADSYSVGSKCYMQTTFDHGIGEVEVDTPQGTMAIGKLFDLLEPGPGSQLRPLYNDIQCGNGPTNTHSILDEILCPGLVEHGIEGCGQIGPLWDLSELEEPTTTVLNNE